MIRFRVWLKVLLTRLTSGVYQLFYMERVAKDLVLQFRPAPHNKTKQIAIDIKKMLSSYIRNV